MQVSGSPGKSITPLAKGRQRQMTLMVQVGGWVGGWVEPGTHSNVTASCCFQST
jgi:hypothetical protein